MGTFANFSDENPSVHLLRALVRRIRYLRYENETGQISRLGLKPRETLCEAFHYAPLCGTPAGMHGGGAAR
jgi:hypothetical protein